MDSYQQFKDDIKNAVDEFKKLDKNETIRLISHLDADGISAASLMVKCLSNDNRKYSISIIQNLNRDFIMQLSREPYKYLIFTDIGSGSLNDIKELLKEKNIRTVWTRN